MVSTIRDAYGALGSIHNATGSQLLEIQRLHRDAEVQSVSISPHHSDRPEDYDVKYNPH